ncbi:hypothetical protein C8J57DRAFT_1616216 [Mycena rebaudengoi]|nr:hypothetical protein C8J57DRAFT_1616216 [Mycena rebaudengoi]
MGSSLRKGAGGQRTAWFDVEHRSMELVAAPPSKPAHGNERRGVQRSAREKLRTLPAKERRYHVDSESAHCGASTPPLRFDEARAAPDARAAADWRPFCVPPRDGAGARARALWEGCASPLLHALPAKEDGTASTRARASRRPTYIRRFASTAAEGDDSPRRDAVTLEGEGALEERVHLASRRRRLAALLEPRPCGVVRGALEEATRAYKRLARRRCARLRFAKTARAEFRRHRGARSCTLRPYDSTRCVSCIYICAQLWRGPPDTRAEPHTSAMSAIPRAPLMEELRAFLARTDEGNPLPIPLELSELPGQVYLDLALEYIKSYPFSRTFQVPRQARTYLTACVNVYRSGLAAIADSYNAEREQQRFVQVVFQQWWVLEELASEVMALVGLVRSETRTASDVATPSESGNKTIPEHVRDRDLRCRMTGISRAKWRMTEEDLLRGSIASKTLSYYTVQFTTSLGRGNSTWSGLLMERYGVPMHLMWRMNIFKAIIRARSGTEFFLASFNDAQRRNCSQPGVLIDQPLKPPHDTNVNDIDRKYFVLHKFIGDIVWMSGVYDDDELEDEEMYVTEDNIDLIMAKLSAPEMDSVPREREAIFGTRMVWVHKDKVWED